MLFSKTYRSPTKKTQTKSLLNIFYYNIDNLSRSKTLKLTLQPLKYQKPRHNGADNDGGRPGRDAGGAGRQPAAGPGDADERGPSSAGRQRTADHGAHGAAERTDTGGPERAGPAADPGRARFQSADGPGAGAAAAAAAGADRADGRRTDVYLSVRRH